MPITIRDIARRAGVSTSTVSRALNNNTRISEKTRKRIHKIARSMGYRPNRIARGLATCETNTIGLIMPTTKCLGYTMSCLALEGIHQEIQKMEYSLYLSVVNLNTRENEIAAGRLGEYGVDGFILGCFNDQYIADSKLAKLIQLDIPFVAIGNYSVSLPNVTTIACDNSLGAYKAIRHLIKLGHEKIAAICSSSSGPVTRGLMEGYRTALEESGIHYPEDFLRKITREVDFHKPGDGETAIYSLLDEGVDFTAVFVFGDAFAAEAIRAFQRRGYHVPDDYAVVGFGGSEYCELLTPALTTVEQPYREIGAKAAQTLGRLIREEKPPDNRILISPRLIIRESCGAIQ